MTLNRWDAKRDANESEIVKAFQSFGISVYRLNQPLDLLLGFNKMNYLVEVKVPGKKLNEKQSDFVKGWKGQHFICSTVEQARRFALEIIACPTR